MDVAANYCSEQIYGIHADPTDCRKYLLCNAGHAYPVTCADGLAFNPAVLGCDYDIGGMCGNAAQLNGRLKVKCEGCGDIVFSASFVHYNKI